MFSKGQHTYTINKNIKCLLNIQNTSLLNLLQRHNIKSSSPTDGCIMCLKTCLAKTPLKSSTLLPTLDWLDGIK